MPTVNVDKECLFKALGKSFTTKEFEELCFEFGIELEDDTTEMEMAIKEVGADKAKGLSNRGIYRIDIPANRYDLVCLEGIARAIKTFLTGEPAPIYAAKEPADGKMHLLYIKAETAQIRPYCVAAILRGIKFDPITYASFIDLQDKLHANLGRRRTLVSMGTHDLDSVEGPFTYEALPPKNIKFAPLNSTRVMDGEELMHYYDVEAENRSIAKFLPIIRDSSVYPVIYDAKRRVMSLPPIINSDHSKISLNTKNVFIEITATDLTKAKVALNMVVTMFSEYCKDKFKVEPVQVFNPDGTFTVTPDLSTRTVEVDVEYINKDIGVKIPSYEIARILTKMSYRTKLSSDGKQVIVQVPPTRSDVLHACDIIEDVAIGFGYDHIPKTLPVANTIAAPLPVNKLTDQLRREVALAGYTEALPFILCSHDENFKYLNRKDDGSQAVTLANPRTAEFQVVRSTLLPGLLKTIASNKSIPLPLKIFEVSDVVFKDLTAERKTRNQRNLCAVYCAKAAGFEYIHGLLDHLMTMLSTRPVPVGQGGGYYITESDNPTFFPGRCADVYYNKAKIGSFGVLHPNVLADFQIPNPCSALEFNVEPFL
ncbi:phenylalanine---tRNA ligase [Synchytrium endobioticum]|nr:phenylalanine---tRNA ligase [Synchytrium endobioticum]